jgi:hypothetical protein
MERAAKGDRTLAPFDVGSPGGSVVADQPNPAVIVRDQDGSMILAAMPQGRSGRHGPEGTGIASVYSDHHTASGERMISGAMTAAHRTGRSDHDAGRRAYDFHPVIHGKLHENSCTALRRDIVNAHRDLLVNERILT